MDLPNHNANISLDAFVVMPDHVHGVVIIRDMDIETPHVGPGSEPDPTLNGVPITHHGLPEIVRQLKTFSARRINELRNTKGVSVWQRNYYERIIRQNGEIERIRTYIRNNLMRR